jgi:hypothetical protein
MRAPERIKIYLDLLKERSKTSTPMIVKELITSDTLNVDELYNELERVWLENPDWRFTQLCVNTGLIPNLPGMWYYTEDREFMEGLGFPMREILLWGTRGKKGNEPLRYIQLKDMTNEHIQSILDTQTQLNKETKQFFSNELELRKEKPELNIFENFTEI